MTQTRPILWTPTRKQREATRMAAFMRWLKAERGLEFDDYNALWDWSITDLEEFWSAIWSFFDLQSSTDFDCILSDRDMPGARWFPQAYVNFASQMLRQAQKTPDRTALIVHSETFGQSELTWDELASQVASVAARLRGMGVGQGDRVVAILPNTEVAMIAFLATASLGAIWSLCSPDMGHVAILDRFRQIEPKVLIAQDGYVHAGKMIDRSAVVAEIAGGLPTLEQRILISARNESSPDQTRWQDLLNDKADLEFAQVPFDHPLWVVYSSGTTGDPKPIAHGHGGILIEGAKQSLHHDLGPQDRYCWLTSSGWIMWNSQLISLGQGATLAMFDGAPNYPDLKTVWRFVSDHEISFFGAGAAFYTGCMKAGIRPGDVLDLAALRGLGSTGSPLTSDGYEWVYNAVKSDVWLAPISGGTDLCGGFVGGNPMLPVRAGEMQCRFLGNAVRAFDEAGHELIGEVGELVCTEPLPSMPLFFWGDTDGSRLHGSYFDTYPGIWRHGDWIEITPEGGAVIYGRSDATINRKGLRLGSSEIYQAVEGLDEVLDSLVVDLEFLGRDSFMPLFVVLPDDKRLDDGLKERINQAIRTAVSARFVPSEIVQIKEIPRTISGKKLEVPVKKLLLGGDPNTVVNRDAMANADSLDAFIEYHRARN
ncbi:acetoacetate--CoA ligase [Rhodobacteraceae bacterium F11138]|nr:acetoacetate--CoA ligase [Rhodobacteraceae bacterium F11138]